MSEGQTQPASPSDIPAAAVETRTRFSVVWLIPLTAAIIGIWLAYKALSERGPIITIAFDSADGLEAGTTKIKYKDVDVGLVQELRLSDDLSQVLVIAQLDKGMEGHVTNETRFWVVRARVGAGQVSGLGTLFSGPYIGMDPGMAGESARRFQGLEKPPMVTTDEPGRHFVLQADTLGSLDVGSPVYFRQIRVGQVVAHQLQENGRAVLIRVFVHAPYHRWVRKNTRFWNASGLDVSLDAEGVQVNTESLTSLLIGGVGFDTPPDLGKGGVAEKGDQFFLYENHEAIYEKSYAEKEYYLLYFAGSVRGLTVGAPVEFRGIKVGEVADIKLEFDAPELDFRVPVLIEIEPERIEVVGGDRQTLPENGIDLLVDKGLRAQLRSGNLFTGQLYVDFDFYPEAPQAQVAQQGKYQVVPTIPTPLDEITGSLTNLLARIEALPIEQIGHDLSDAVQGAQQLITSDELGNAIDVLNETLQQTQTLVANLNATATPAIRATLAQVQETLSAADTLLQDDAPLQLDLRRVLRELSEAARSIRTLADYLERHPEALIRGKGVSR
jgi:paraquat-inducible protein B